MIHQFNYKSPTINALALGIIMLYSFSLFARIPNYETTRLKSTAGTGVGSLLMDEASILNPAPLAFFNVTSLYYQQTRTAISPSPANNPPKPELMGFIVSDAGNSMKGSLSYQKQAINFNERERWALALASPMGKKSSMGVTYRRTTDLISKDYGASHEKSTFSQIVIGIFHAISSDFTLGLAFIDPTKVREEDVRALTGAQYNYKQFVVLMLDIGTNYNDNISDTFLYHTALQVKVFSDFFIRCGIFKDNGLNEKGNGIGLGWVQPKLVFELAIKNTTVAGKIEQNLPEEEIKETSFSLSYRF